MASSCEGATTAKGSMPSPPYVFRSCTNCGGDGERTHQLRRDGAIRHFCTSCILLLHKGMYCSLCFLVNEKLGDPSLWLTCSKCQRLCHLKCASDRDLPTSSMFFTCLSCSNLEKPSSNDGDPPSKKPRFSVVQQGEHTTPAEGVAAAQIVALLAVQEARGARARARASASVAAKAAARAKAALDTAYRIAQEYARWRAESSKRCPSLLTTQNRGMSLLPGQSASKNGREEGTAFASVLPSTLSRLLPFKEQVASGNTKFGTQNYKPKVSQPVSEAAKPLIRYPEASSQGLPFQTASSVSAQEAVEQSQTSGDCETAVVSASPASILDAAGSLDGLQLNKSADSVLHGGRGAAKTSISSPLGLPVGGLSVHSTQPPLPKDHPQILDKTGNTEGDTSI